MCLDDQVLSSYIDGELQEPWKTQVEEHISHCKSCRERYEQFARLDQTLFETRIQNDEFTMHQQRVWKYLEKTCMPSQPKRFRHKRFAFSGPAMAAAAAVMVALIGVNIYLVRGTDSPSTGGEQGIPTLTAEQNQIPLTGEADDSVIAVSARAHRTSAIAPQELSVDELLFLLEQKGFEVELKRSDATTPVHSYETGSPAQEEETSGAARYDAASTQEAESDDDAEDQENQESTDQDDDGWSDWD